MMGKNRKLPFGYWMECGRVVAHPEEAPWVKYIFKNYISGASFNKLTAAMMEEGPVYDEDKPWNKNMIARMLGDTRYRGEKGFPAIIDTELFQKAAAIRSAKGTVIQKTPAQKMLRRKCGFPVTPYIEQEVLYLMNCLIRNPDQIATPKDVKVRAESLDMLKSELENLLTQLPMDEERTRKELMQIAVVMYETIDSREYETYRIRKLLGKEQQLIELSDHMIAMTISAVMVDSNGNVKIKLKNDQIIGRGE